MSDELPPDFIVQENSDPAELMVGPFYKHVSQNITLMKPRAELGNALGIIHGGMLMTFADFTLCASAIRETGDSDCMTVNLNTNFVDGAPIDAWVRGEATIRKVTGRMVFVDGVLTSGGDTVLTFSGIGRRIRSET